MNRQNGLKSNVYVHEKQNDAFINKEDKREVDVSIRMLCFALRRIVNNIDTSVRRSEMRALSFLARRSIKSCEIFPISSDEVRFDNLLNLQSIFSYQESSKIISANKELVIYRVRSKIR